MKVHLLLIGNDALIVKSFSEAFVRSDSVFKCTCAENIDHARSIMEFIVPDCIFIRLDEDDVMASLQFVAHLKRTARFNKVKVIVFSEQIDYYKNLSKAHGANLCILPPYEAGDIHRALDVFYTPGAFIK